MCSPIPSRASNQLPRALNARADKHAWGYDWLNGGSGDGVDDLMRAEINSIDPATNTDYTDVSNRTVISMPTETSGGPIRGAAI
ncbi:type I phosphodiesterase/nucleotide pyrophosphatase [Caballeronia hypogeia]|uniref:Type I phosphodiesterase/nucleotide pyrophosphatase n=1 Tax=Caballeronia hypogeia TaxID=1777140 RepID=A0A158AGB2_9BURK|nr:hypothetical protein [Caballeronia hypogeia]SAK56755.1 type I phosphodiesterase/nucleotide pyrophosphatase [Caballeronia hypogeia]